MCLKKALREGQGKKKKKKPSVSHVCAKIWNCFAWVWKIAMYKLLYKYYNTKESNKYFGAQR